MASTKTATLAKFGLGGVALGAVLSLTVTTLTATTANLTTVNATEVEVNGTLSGSTFQINKQGIGSGKLLVNGGSGSYLCLRDSDSAGYSMIRALNGTLTTTIAGPTMCP